MAPADTAVSSWSSSAASSSFSVPSAVIPLSGCIFYALSTLLAAFEGRAASSAVPLKSMLLASVGGPTQRTASASGFSSSSSTSPSPAVSSLASSPPGTKSSTTSPSELIRRLLRYGSELELASDSSSSTSASSCPSISSLAAAAPLPAHLVEFQELELKWLSSMLVSFCSSLPEPIIPQTVAAALLRMLLVPVSG